MNKQEPNIEDTIDKLKLLAETQDQALKCANEIISMKNKLIELCEEETALYKKEVIRKSKTILVLSGMLFIISILLLCKP